MSSIQQYIDLYHAQRALLNSHSCGMLNECREQAALRLEMSGLPDTRTERYKYTSAEQAFAPDYGLNLRRSMAVDNPYKTYHCSVPNLSTSLFFVINDVVAQPAQRGANLPEGVTVGSLAAAGKENPRFIEQFYHRAASAAPDAVTELNTLLVQDGLLVHVARGTHLKSPIQIVNMSSAGLDMMSNRRLLIVAEEDTDVNVLVCDHAEGTHRYLTTQVTEVYAAAAARVGIYTLEETTAANTRFSQIYVEQQAASRVLLGGITLTAGLSRTMTNVRLCGENARVEAFGAVIADAEQHVDHNILVDHACGCCTSDMLYKYVLNASSVGAFAGKVLVREGAQQTLSEQTNANLCVSPTARAFSQPMLEIYADDVKCNHGSTIGRLDETALFYMCQRGIPEPEARLLLQHAFINDVLQKVEVEPLRDRLSHLVEMRFRGELRKCRGCNLCN